MGQINISCEDRLIRDIDRVAAARGLRRADMLRAIAVEAIEAHDAGRLAFEADEQPRIDSSLNALAVQLRQAVIEMDRSQRAGQRHEKRLLDAWAGGEEANRLAELRLTEQISKIHKDGFDPFRGEVEELREAFELLPEQVITSVARKLGEIDTRLEAVCVLAGQPRTQYNLVLGDDRTLSAKFLAILLGLTAAIAPFAFLLVVGQIQPVARPVASRLIADSENFCRLLNRRYGVLDCEVPKDERDLALRVIKVEEERK